VGGGGLDLSSLEQGWLADSCEYDNVSSGSIKFRIFFTSLGTINLSRMTLLHRVRSLQSTSCGCTLRKIRE
jgi:hypothetical protein